MSTDWKIKAAEKRRQQANSIPPEWRLKEIPTDFSNTLEFIRTCKLLTPEELRLTEITDGHVLQTLLTTGKITCQEVITAFSKRAAIAHQLCNCLTEIFFDVALARAKELDDHFKKTGKPVGPLHGFPISFKDGFNIEGLDTVCCFRLVHMIPLVLINICRLSVTYHLVASSYGLLILIRMGWSYWKSCQAKQHACGYHACAGSNCICQDKYTSIADGKKYESPIEARLSTWNLDVRLVQPRLPSISQCFQ